MKTVSTALSCIGMLLFVTSANALDNDKLVSVCGHSDVSIKKQVKIEQSTSVSLLQGGMLRIDSKGPMPTEQLLQAEMKNIGVSNECTEYFISQGTNNPIDGRVYFAFDSDKLTSASITVLDAMLDHLGRAENNITLAGHTDSIGSDGYNFSLGLKRAMSVQEFLQDNNVAQKNIEAVSYGEKQPIASNSSSEGRKLNRRVEISGN
ncbi:outer membrane protein [Vibrio sp. N418]|uniref:OmpA family protein n=1 Tax=Vibrio sp. (strain N418) TaxID=701176 RepID=UPI00021BFA28|nr:OmpA family protein [Vibrio sp. N418]EGU36035.1 outer membrane protein [Vibrio sp. N418]